jgi:lipopolysaccharide transport system permease protein
MSKKIIINSIKIRNISLFLELLQYRKLILIIFRREFISSYKQTVLGPLWIVLNPLITSFVFTLIFSNIAKISTDQIPPFLFFFSGLTIWSLFQNNIIQISSFYISSASYFKKLYFPRLVIPFSYLLNNTIRFVIQFAILLLFIYVIYDFKLVLNFYSFLLILFVFIYCQLFCLGLGLIINTFTYKYRDLNYLTTYAMTIWMYLSPIAYPVSQAPAKLQLILLLNPITPIIELFRYSLFNIGLINKTSIIVSLVSLFSVLFIGIFLFIKTEKNFIDNV